ncbi:MAG TPA: adenylate/guanylate cyclase domain-containing protein [Chloroflexota bacterium]|nr:adenylate/guanylate cyclase domain-containing protein [Chloroflexota bacterium]
MALLPTGTVTFLFTDVEGSTRLWELHPAQMREALVAHDAIVELLAETHGGQVVRPRGEGDSRFCVFSRATDAAHAAAAIQRALLQEPWPPETPLKVRIALHTGEADLRDGDYYGSAVNRAARIRALAHGGQTLLSMATEELVRDSLPPRVTLADLGEHRLKDLGRPERIFQLAHPDLPADFPPLRSLDALPNNLPLQLTSFVGRERDLDEARQLVRANRLLTLTGTGGCGKTRLSLQAAADELERFPDGVWFVELAPIADPAHVAPAVAAALGHTLDPALPPIPQLVDLLRTKHALVVLDNCEHVVEACARLADALLRSCPHLHVMATSREALGIAGERSWRIPSLAVPDAGFAAALTQGTQSVESLSQYEAVRLFIARAASVQADFQVTNANAPAVAQICWRLDGIPLAIELAAARIKVLSVEQIAQRLDDSFRLLTGGSRTALPRQQTLRALVDWSFALLSAKDRAVLRRVSVFMGGFTLEAAARAALDAPTFEACWAEGKAMTLDTAIAYSREHSQSVQPAALPTT